MSVSFGVIALAVFLVLMLIVGGVMAGLLATNGVEQRDRRK